MQIAARVTAAAPEELERWFDRSDTGRNAGRRGPRMP
jgi:hypothetical protein